MQHETFYSPLTIDCFKLGKVQYILLTNFLWKQWLCYLHEKKVNLVQGTKVVTFYGEIQCEAGLYPFSKFHKNQHIIKVTKNDCSVFTKGDYTCCRYFFRCLTVETLKHRHLTFSQNIMLHQFMGRDCKNPFFQWKDWKENNFTCLCISVSPFWYDENDAKVAGNILRRGNVGLNLQAH